MKPDLLAASGALMRCRLNLNPPQPQTNPLTMFALTRRTITIIHRAAVGIATANACIAGFMIGLLAHPDGGTAMQLVFCIAAIFWTLVALLVAMKTRQHPRGFIPLQRNVEPDAFGDLRFITSDGTASRDED
jgi:hypothetical protein